MAKIISFSNQKGGVGKTTTCVNLAVYLALKKHKVLMLDMDPQGNASSTLGVFDKRVKKSTYSVLCDEMPIGEAIQHSEVDGLDFVPSSNDLSGAELELSQIVIGRERVLEQAIGQVQEEYDYIFIDCPPSLGLLTVNALTASGAVIVPIQCEYFALEGLSQMMNTIKLVKKYLNPSLEVEGVVLTMYDARSRLSKEVQQQLAKFFGDKIYDVKIPRNVRLAEAPSYGKPVALYDKKCSGALAYEALCEEFIQKNK